MRYFIILLIAVLSSSCVDAQLLSKNENFTKKDTLRGMLSEDRDWFDVTYYNLHIKIDTEAKTIEGYNQIFFEVLRKHDVMQIDLFENMNVDKIVFQEKRLKFKREYNAVFLEMPEDIELTEGEVYDLKFYYSGEPISAPRAPWDGGFDWKKDSEGNPFVGVACEGTGASLWWPNKDHLSEEPDSMMISVAVPKGLTCVSNGNLRSQEEESGFERFNWFVSYPINNYNVTVNIAKYVNFNDVYVSGEDSLALEYYVLPENLEKAKEHFKQVKPMMRCFETYLGKYPFWDDGFALVETPYLGMEHQSAIAYGNKYKTGYNGMDFSGIGLEFDYIIIHEAGHEWWGNSVSVADIADLWIHEGFCTYSEAIYVECMHGYETAMAYVNAKKRSVGNKSPVIGPYDVNEEGDGDMYNKGMLILNTLRHVLGDDEKWFNLILDITQDFERTVVTSQQIEEYIMEKTGLDLKAFWDQYLRHSDLPILEHKIGKRGKKVVVEYRWVTDVPNFEMPIKYSVDGEKWVDIKPTNKWQRMTFKDIKPSDFKWDEKHYYYNIQ